MNENFVGPRRAAAPLGPATRSRGRTADPGVRITYGPRQLSNREHAIVKKVAEGLRDSDIAADLFINEGTVRQTIQRVRDSLGLVSRLQLVIWAYENGVVVPAYLKDCDL